MKLLVVYSRIYAECFVKALKALARSPWTLVLPWALMVATTLAISLLARISPLLAMVLGGLVLAAGYSCYLYFISELVSHAKVRLADLKKSFGAYFWSVVNVLFLIWIISFFIGPLTRANAQLQILWVAARLVAFILFNAVPEVIYLRGSHGGLATLTAAMQFFQQNWVEWLIPNAVFIAVAWPFAGALLNPFGAPLASLALGAWVHLAFVYRGFLFESLHGTSHRQRMFRFRGTS